MTTTGLAKYFEDFVEKLLTRSGIEMSREHDGGSNFLGVSDKGTRAAIEVKLYSSGSVSPALLQKAAAAIAWAARDRHFPQGGGRKRHVCGKRRVTRSRQRCWSSL